MILENQDSIKEEKELNNNWNELRYILLFLILFSQIVFFRKKVPKSGDVFPVVCRREMRMWRQDYRWYQKTKDFHFVLSWPFWGNFGTSFFTCRSVIWWAVLVRHQKNAGFFFFSQHSLCHSLSVLIYYLIFFYLPLWITSNFSSKMWILVSLYNQCPLNVSMFMSRTLYFHFLQPNDSNNPQLKTFLKITSIKSRKQLRKESQPKDKTC